MDVQCRRRLESLSLCPGEFASMELKENDILDIVSVALGEGFRGESVIVVWVELGDDKKMTLAKLRPGRKEQEIIHLKVPSSCQTVTIKVEAIDENKNKNKKNKGRKEESVDILLEHTTVIFGSMEDEVREILEVEKEIEELKKLEEKINEKQTGKDVTSRVGNIIQQKRALRDAKKVLKERAKKEREDEIVKKSEELKKQKKKELEDKKVILSEKVKKVGNTRYEILRGPKGNEKAALGDIVTIVINNKSSNDNGEEQEVKNITKTFRISSSSSGVEKFILQGIRGMGLGEVRRIYTTKGDKDSVFDVEMKSIKIDDE